MPSYYLGMPSCIAIATAIAKVLVNVGFHIAIRWNIFTSKEDYEMQNLVDRTILKVEEGQKNKCAYRAFIRWPP